jgi:hypothetical protein
MSLRSARKSTTSACRLSSGTAGEASRCRPSARPFRTSFQRPLQATAGLTASNSVRGNMGHVATRRALRYSRSQLWVNTIKSCSIPVPSRGPFSIAGSSPSIGTRQRGRKSPLRRAGSLTWTQKGSTLIPRRLGSDREAACSGRGADTGRECSRHALVERVGNPEDRRDPIPRLWRHRRRRRYPEPASVADRLARPGSRCPDAEIEPGRVPSAPSTLRSNSVTKATRLTPCE